MADEHTNNGVIAYRQALARKRYRFLKLKSKEMQLLNAAMFFYCSFNEIFKNYFYGLPIFTQLLNIFVMTDIDLDNKEKHVF